MKFWCRVSLLAGLMILLLTMIPQFAVADPGGQTWYLTETDAPSVLDDGVINKVMTQEAGAQDATITLAPAQDVYWYTDKASACSTAFPSGDWTVTFWVKALNDLDNGKYIYVELYTVDAFGTASRQWQKKPTISEAGTVREISISKEDASSFDIPENGRLAVRIRWVGTADGNLEVYFNSTDHNSRIAGPISNPVWPMPDMTSGLLLFSGMACLGGYIWLQRKRYSHILCS